jgi:predicted MPP superfamily phosphohydrolase
LTDEHYLFHYKNSTILVTGITQIYSKRISQQKLDSLLATAPEADLKILLVHQPTGYIIKTAEKYGYDLFLAGHTHGGQVVFKPLGISVTPTRFENFYYTGLHKIGNMDLIITNGIGLTMWPLRYHAPAEIVEITF